MSTSVPDTKVDNASLQNIFLSNRPTSNNEEDDAWDDVELPDDGLGNDIFAEAPPDELFDGMGWDEDPVLALDDLGGSVESGVGDIKMETDESKSGKECDSVTGTGRTGEDLEDLDLDLETLEIPVAQSETQRHELGGADAFGGMVCDLSLSFKNKSKGPMLIPAWEGTTFDLPLDSAVAASHPDFEGPLNLLPNCDQSPGNVVVAGPEAMDEDFDLPAENLVLKLADRSAQKHPADITSDIDLSFDGWSDTLSVHKDLPFRRFLASPTPSSTASMIASESEDEAFDDIEFPDSVEALRLGAYRHTGQSSEVEMDGEDDADDPSAGLVIPDDGTLHPGRLKVTPIAGPTPSPRAASPSKIPRLVPSAFVSSYVQADMHGKPKPLTGTYISGPDRRTGPSAPISPSLGHIQRLSSQLISQRKLHGDSPTKLIRKPKGAQQYGDGTELDTFDDLPVSSTTENKFVKTIKVTPKINPAKPVHNTSLKRSSSKAGSMGSIVSSPEERENRRPYTAGGPVHHRPSQTYQDRRPPTSHKRRPRKKPTLIRNLNNSNAVKVVGDMVYNPALQKWEGNEDVLAEFDKALPSRPALITNKGGYKMPQVVGNMVFDPIKMCWVGNDEEADVFADISDDMSVVTEMGSGGFVPEQTEFNLSKSFKEAMCIAESSHKLFMGKWYPKAVLDSRTMMRDTSKTHLYEIRSHTNGDRRPKLMGRHAIWR